MSLSIGIVGLPNVGKSTLFNALTKKSVLVANYPFATIDPSVGVVAVPDPRLNTLAELSCSEKVIPAAVEFVDIAGLVKGASEGEGLGNQFLHNIRETDAIAHVVRIFEDPDITHVHGGISPLDDIGVINLELVLADYSTVSKHRGTIQKEVKRGDKDALALDTTLSQIETELQAGKMISSLGLSSEELLRIKHLNLLTAKPMLYVLNKKSGGRNLDEIDDERWQSLMGYMLESGSLFVKVDASTELDMNELSQEEKESFKTEMGLQIDEGIDALIKRGYELLGLITYFTTGEKETRGWTTKINSTAPEAATSIHTDFKEKFIRAEVIYWENLIMAGSRAVAREKGWLRTEGKEYIVQDGDVIEFKI